MCPRGRLRGQGRLRGLHLCDTLAYYKGRCGLVSNIWITSFLTSVFAVLASHPIT